MPSPFPGMDAYLEKPSLWPDLHIELITAVRAALKSQLGKSHRVRIEERVYISTADDPGRAELVPNVQIVSRATPGSSPIVSKTRPGVETAEPLVIETMTAEEIRQPYLEISDAASRKVLTVIEVLSPMNKVSRSQGLKSFRQKRNTVMLSHSHWVEIDLLTLLGEHHPSDHGRETVVRTGAASNLARQCDPPEGRADARGWRTFVPSEPRTHVRGHKARAGSKRWCSARSLDLLRCGVSLGARKRIRPHEYLVHVSPVGMRPDGLSLGWPIRLSERLPVIPIPLHADQNTPLDIQAVLNTAYGRGGNETEVDYTTELISQLSKEWRVWADQLLREKGLRPPAGAG